MQRILQEIVKKNNTWNIRRLVNKLFVPANQQTRVLYCRLSDFKLFISFVWLGLTNVFQAAVDPSRYHVRHSAANVICVMKMLSHLIQLCNDRKHCWVALILHLFSISIQSWTFNSFICKTMAFIKVLRYFPCTPEETSYIGCLSVELEQTWYTYPWFYLIQDLA